MRPFAIMAETDPSQEIATEQSENDNPESEESLTIEDMPAICQVCHGEELESKSQFEEAEYHLHHIQPSSALRHTLQPAGEDRKKSKGQSQ